jgi:hypothetical protein
LRGSAFAPPKVYGSLNSVGSGKDAGCSSKIGLKMESWGYAMDGWVFARPNACAPLNNMGLGQARALSLALSSKLG